MTKTNAAIATVAAIKSRKPRPSRAKAAIAERAASTPISEFDVGQLKAILANTQIEVSDLKAEIATRDKALASLQATYEHDTADQKMNGDLKDTLAIRTSELDLATRAVDAMTNINAELHSKITELSTARVLLDDEAIGLRAKMKTAADTAAERIGELQRLLATRNAEVERVTGELKALQDNLEKADKTRNADVAELLATVQDRDAQISRLRTRPPVLPHLQPRRLIPARVPPHQPGLPTLC